MFIYVCRVHTPQECIWTFKSNFVKSLISFLIYVGSGDGTQVTRPVTPRGEDMETGRSRKLACHIAFPCREQGELGGGASYEPQSLPPVKDFLYQDSSS